MIAVPAATAVTRPFASTVAIASSLLDQVTVGLLAFSGATVAVSCRVSPIVTSAVVSFSVTEVASTTAGLTVTAQAAVRLLPSLVVAVIVAVPGATAVTRPFASTVATPSLLLVQVTVWSVASSGNTVAASCRVSPSVISAAVLSSSSDSADFTTVTEQAVTGKACVVELVSEAITLFNVMTFGPTRFASAMMSNVTKAPLLPVNTVFRGEAIRIRIAPDESRLDETVCVRVLRSVKPKIYSSSSMATVSPSGSIISACSAVYSISLSNMIDTCLVSPGLILKSSI